MRTYSTDHALTEAFRIHEDRVAHHLRDAEVRRALPRPTSALRVRIAHALHALADRLEPRPAGSLFREVMPVPFRAGTEIENARSAK